MSDGWEETYSTNDFGIIAQLLCAGTLLSPPQDLEQDIGANRMTYQYYLYCSIWPCLAFNRSFEHLAYVFDLLFQVVGSFWIAIVA